MKVHNCLKKSKETQFPEQGQYSTPYQDAQRLMEQFLSERIQRYENEKESNEDSSEKMPHNIALLQHIRHSMRICKDETEFFKDIDYRFEDYLNDQKEIV